MIMSLQQTSNPGDAYYYPLGGGVYQVRLNCTKFPGECSPVNTTDLMNCGPFTHPSGWIGNIVAGVLVENTGAESVAVVGTALLSGDDVDPNENPGATFPLNQ